MDDDKLYEQIYNDIKEHFIAHSIYSPNIFKDVPSEYNIFPLAIIPRPESTFASENLHKGEQKFNITFEINIYVKTKEINGQTVPKNIVAKELRKLVDEIMFTKYGMNRITDRPIPNLDSDILRIFLRYTCLFDKDKAIIYRNK
jgi:hypothetical protein